ncbi:F-type conjugal transfer protein TraH [Escherichia coli]|nr:F-type conjugal transfer protein TraH [Escherichia coli]
MLRIKPLFILCAALLTVTPAASADVNSDMNQFFNKLGFASNTTQPGVWQGQAAGYAYGGSLYARTQVKNVQLISMTLPDINAGCGGIDAYLGSFSFINGEQLQRFVKQIMSNAAGYFFDLALQTTVPEIKTAKDFLQKMASDINSMNLSSCQAAQGIIGGLFPRTQVSQQKVCQDIAGESNIFSDWAASRQGCTVGGKSDSVRDKASDKDKERVTKNINIMWNALSKNRMFDGNKELKEFVMTLTGSLVFGPNGEITPLSARTTDRSIIRAMMEGGTAKIYHCNDSDKCLKVVADTPVTISRDNAQKSQITKLLASIQNKAVSDTPLDDKEKGFISSTTIPVFKYLVDPQMLGVSNSMIYQLTDYIGYFTSRKVSESGSHTDNNADSRVDQLSAALNSAKQSYDQYTTNMTRSHEYAEMASCTESMSGQMSEDLSQQFAQYVMKHAPQDAEAILTNTSSPEIAERRRAMAWSFVQEQVQPGVDNAWRESRGDIGKGMESVPSGGGSQDIIADHQGHQVIIEQRTQDSNIRNDVKHQVDNMVTEYRGNIGDTQSSIHGEENIVGRQYSELQNHHKTEALSQNNKYDEERESQKIIPEPSGEAVKKMIDGKKERLKGPL